MQNRILSHGAEAKVLLTYYLGRKAIIKKREKKVYREKKLDEKIRKERTKSECILLHKAKLCGIRTPIVWKIEDDFSLIMEFIDGETLKEKIMKNDITLIQKVGKIVAKLHENNIIHGDLTTANFVVEKDNLALVDFGLGYFSSKEEDKAVDLLNFKKTFLATHFEYAEKWFELEKKYKENYSQGEKILKQMEKIEKRARYY
ncbi:MAG: KEOPS complex kinase/ATPase Bud32 [Candidatus Diapherotrites archaeon]